MNRSVLIVICDFLLVSLLAFSTVDINKVPERAAPRNVVVQTATNQVERGQDLTAVMQLALTEERKGRDALLAELGRARSAAGEKQAQLEQQQARLQQQYSTAQTNIQTLNQQLLNRSTENVVAREQLTAMEAELRRQTEQAAALQEQMAQLDKRNQQMLHEKQQLAQELQVAEVEKRSAAEHAARMTEEVKVEREEKAKLAEGVKSLAEKSGALAQEVRENRSLTPNAIFTEFATNRVHAQFYASRPGLFGGESTRSRETETVLVTDGTNTFALCHLQDTPLSLMNPGKEWDGLSGALERNGAVVPIHSLSFYQLDPRIVLMPVTEAEARTLGVRVYHVSNSPFKFQEAVVVGAREGYYGESKFQNDLAAPYYLRMDHNSLKGIFGKFNPSRGDVVFSQTGEMLGIMANNSYCILIQNFNSAATFQFSPDVREQHTAETLARLYSRVSGLPFRLQ